MEFNRNWTKQDNNKMRQMIKEKKSVDEIRNYFGNDKLFYHPTKKYYHSGKSGSIPTFKEKIKDYSGFINEIKYESLKTDFTIDFKKSKHFKEEFDYLYRFQTESGNRYIVDFIYLKDNLSPFPNKEIYNISLTLEENRNLSDYEDYEKLSKLNEQHELLKRLIFICKDFNDRFSKDKFYLIGETEDKRKINWYRNLISDSFDNVEEIVGKSSFTNGLNAYYFSVK
jgi:hypothetical protein